MVAQQTLINWAGFLVFLGGCWYVFFYRPSGRERARRQSFLRPNNTTTSKGDVQWSDSDSKKAPKAAKAKAPKKSVKKTVQEVGKKIEASLPSALTSNDDGGDDASPTVSPPSGATANKAPSGKDVSDMLENKGSGPSVLRINASDKPARPNKPQQPRAETPQETKKQRQNRQKNEEAKRQREEAEKERQVLLEKQRRTAREARGEPAKNGIPAKAPATNAWASGRPAGAVESAATQGQLLDTFDPEAVSTTSSSEAATNGTAPTPDSLANSNDWTSGLTEQQQLQMALEDSAWETVPKGKKTRKPKAAEDAAEETTETPVAREPAPVKEAPAKKAATKAPEVKKTQSSYSVLDDLADVGHPLDSDWGVV